jgi:hypothetical protein
MSSFSYFISSCIQCLQTGCCLPIVQCKGVVCVGIILSVIASLSRPSIFALCQPFFFFCLLLFLLIACSLHVAAGTGSPLGSNDPQRPVIYRCLVVEFVSSSAIVIDEHYYTPGCIADGLPWKAADRSSSNSFHRR